MSAAVQADAGRLAVTGELDFGSVSGVLAETRACFAEPQALTVDLSGVTRTDSAGVALLLEWSRLARQQDCELSFAGIPQQMRNIVDFCELTEILGTGQDA